MSRMHQLGLGLIGQARLLKISASQPSTASAIRRVTRETLSYLSTLPLTELHKAVVKAESEDLPGILTEAGCALGG